MQAKRHSVDMCNGPLFSKIVVFFIPVMLSNILQLVYNAADQIIVGKFAGATSLAAVGSTASLFNLITCLLIGIAVGVSSITARHFGSRNRGALTRTVHTAVATSLLFGLILGIIGFVFSKPLLTLMGTPESVLPKSTLYMQILFAGLPFLAVFNFTSAILRAIGDTKRPMIFMIIAGLMNVLLNLFFVIVFKMDVAGVALATVLSQLLSAVLTIRCLTHTEEEYKLTIKNIKIHKGEFRQIMQIGVPSGIQSAGFSLSNVFLQSAINSFGAPAMTGCTASSSVENLTYQATNAFYHTILAFVGQNYGAGQKKRIKKSVLYCLFLATGIGLAIGCLCTLFGESLLGLFIDKNTDPAFYKEAIAAGTERMRLVLPFYFLCGVMEVGTGALRAMNKSAISMIFSLTGACLLRVIWIYTIFAANPTIKTLFLSYPVTWITTSLFLYGAFIYYYKKLKPRNALQ
ncbi:MAG: MATE family efflux transporter [Clostridia bacterium]|nr:MATE family efflux transporter [Clostridia bacterium]